MGFRLLFTCVGATGHFQPLIAIARAAAARGHEVAFATGAAFCPAVAEHGFRVYPAGFDYAGRPLDVWFPRLRVLAGDAYIRFVAAHIRVRVQARQMVPDLLGLAATYRPDLVVRDAAEYGGCVAAEVLGIPHASVRTAHTSSSFARRLLLAADLTRLRVAFGLPPDPLVDMPFRYLHLACEPPGFSPPDEPMAPTAHLLRPVIVDHVPGRHVAEVPPGNPLYPTVCITLGTVMNRTPGVFGSLLAALNTEPANLVVLVGRDVDPRSFGRQPETVVIRRYIPLSSVLARCQMVVSHAGFGTVVSTLVQGLPSLLMPLGADQPANAAACARLGVARVLDPAEHAPETVRSALRAVLGCAHLRRRAAALRDATALMPGPVHAVNLLERLARDGQPLVATRV
jgi:UDP:flavonoid glycosyltransferase YjiC (YdhE family)